MAAAMRLSAFVGGFLSHFRLGTRALAVCYFLADLYLLRSLGTVQRLPVRIYADKFDALNACGHHAINRISTAAANSDHFYLNDIIEVVINLKRHCTAPPYFQTGISNRGRSRM